MTVEPLTLDEAPSVPLEPIVPAEPEMLLDEALVEMLLGVSPAAMARPGAVIVAKSAMAAAVVKRRIRMMHAPVDDSRLSHQPRGLRSVPTDAGFVTMPGLGHETAPRPATGGRSATLKRRSKGTKPGEGGTRASAQ
ncbi:MAG: hypothetical protein AB7V53_17085 [Dongiaceae bacterium]